MKSVFYWSVSLFVMIVSQNSLANTAASKLAERIYLLGNTSLETKEYPKALRFFEIASLLDTSLEAAKTKKEKWKKFLEERAHQEYEAGIKAFQNKKLEEARGHWNIAFHSLLNKDQPLYSKIEQALTLQDFSPSLLLAAQSQNASEKEETRQKMQEIKGFLDKGDAAQAILGLQEILNKDPKNERAKKLLLRLEEKQKQEPSQNSSQEIQRQFEEAQRKFSQAEAALHQKNYLLAYQYQRETQALFEEGDLKPPFWLELLSKKEKVEEILAKEAKPILAKLEKGLENGSADFKAVGFTLREMEKNYPPLPKVKELLSKVYLLLEARARPSLMKAKTIQELEGCTKAIHEFETVKAFALFSEIPSWQEANKNIEICKKAGHKEADTL